MPTETDTAPPSKGKVLGGWILTGFLVLFLAFDGVTKVLGLAFVVEASEKLGVPSRTLVGIGIVLLACIAIHLIPRTTVLGAILLTGYLGGATAIHVRAGSGAFEIVFAVAFGVLVWVGLILREPRTLRTMLVRK
jgi:hypothetical protein